MVLCQLSFNFKMKLTNERERKCGKVIYILYYILYLFFHNVAHDSYNLTPASVQYLAVY